MDLIQFFGDAFQNTFLGTPAYVWLMLVALWAASVLVLLLLRRLVGRRLGAVAGRTHIQLDDYLVEVVQGTKTFFLVALGFVIAMHFVDVATNVRAVVRQAVFLLFLVQVIVWGNRIITRWIERYRERRLAEDAASVTTMQAVGILARFVLWTVIFLVALDNLGFDVTALIAGLGVGGIAVALAVQNILSDLFASLSIVLDKPFVVGDFLVLDAYAGTVEQIGLKTTRIRSLSGEQIIVSNSDLLQSRIRNYKRMFQRRVVFQFGVVYQTPPDKLAAIPSMIRAIVEAQEKVRFDRAHFVSYGDSALQYEVVYYVLDSDYNVYMDIHQAINLAIYRKFADEGIAFAYPTQMIYVSQAAEADGAAGDLRQATA